MSDRTHWEGCHTRHLECALARLAEVTEERDALRVTLDMVLHIPNMTNDQLEELKARCQKIIDGATDSADAPLTAQQLQDLDDVASSMEREPWSVGSADAAPQFDPDALRTPDDPLSPNYDPEYSADAVQQEDR